MRATAECTVCGLTYERPLVDRGECLTCERATEADRKARSRRAAREAKWKARDHEA